MECLCGVTPYSSLSSCCYVSEGEHKQFTQVMTAIRIEFSQFGLFGLCRTLDTHRDFPKACRGGLYPAFARKKSI